MDIEQTVITPDMARTLLGLNTRNRALSQGRVERIAGAIRRGEWVLNGDSIRIGVDGVLLDGQHRLAAIIKSGIAVPSLIVRGLNPTSFETIDRGETRKSKDDLHLAGVKNANCTAAAARLLHKYRTFGAPYFGTAGSDPTPTQVLAIVEGNPMLAQCSSWVYSRTFCKKMPGPSISAFCRFAFMEDSKTSGMSFFDELESGVGLESGSPILALRQRLMDDVISKTKLTPRYKCALVFKAYKLYRDDVMVKSLRVTTDGDKAEKDIFKL